MGSCVHLYDRCGVIERNAKRIVPRFSACASYSFSPFDSIVYKTISDKLHDEFALYSRLKDVTKSCKNTALEVIYLVEITFVCFDSHAPPDPIFIKLSDTS